MCISFLSHPPSNVFLEKCNKVLFWESSFSHSSVVFIHTRIEWHEVKVVYITVLLYLCCGVYHSVFTLPLLWCTWYSVTLPLLATLGEVLHQLLHLNHKKSNVNTTHQTDMSTHHKTTFRVWINRDHFNMERQRWLSMISHFQDLNSSGHNPQKGLFFPPKVWSADHSSWNMLYTDSLMPQTIHCYKS